MKSTTQNAHRIHWKFSEKSAEAAREKSAPRMLLNAEKCSQIHEWSKPGRRWIYKPLEGAVTETANCCCKKNQFSKDLQWRQRVLEGSLCCQEGESWGRDKRGNQSERERENQSERGRGLYYMHCFVVCMHFISSLYSPLQLFSLILTRWTVSPLLSSPLPCQLSHERPTACHCRWAHALRAVKSFLPLIKGRSAVMQLVKQY